METAPIVELSKTQAVILEKKQQLIQAGTLAAAAAATSSGVGAFGVGAIYSSGQIMSARVEDKAIQKAQDQARKDNSDV